MLTAFKTSMLSAVNVLEKYTPAISGLRAIISIVTGSEDSILMKGKGETFKNFCYSCFISAFLLN